MWCIAPDFNNHIYFYIMLIACIIFIFYFVLYN